jgi:hypothetical protein
VTGPEEVPAYSYGDREPVRMPLWLAILGSEACAFGIALLTDVGWKPALAAALGSLGPLLFGVEIARQRAWSPASVLTTAAQERERGRFEGAVAAQVAADPFGPPPPPPVRSSRQGGSLGADPGPLDTSR